MSSRCICGRKRNDHENLAVACRKCWKKVLKDGTFHEVPSDYSLVVCLRPGCGSKRRTKAGYAETLPDLQKELSE